MSDIYLQNLECFCVKGVTSTCPGGGTLDAFINVDGVVLATLEAEGVIDPDNSRAKCTDAIIETIASVSSKLSGYIGFDGADLDGEGIIDENLIADYSLEEQLETAGSLDNTVDKIFGDIADFKCVEVLYPSGDAQIEVGFAPFAGMEAWLGRPWEDKPLWSYIDEGVYQGQATNGGDSVNLSDDELTFIFPSSQVRTEGFFQHHTLLTDFTVRPDHSRLRMRISAPTQNYESNIPPLYTVYDIKLLDPNGETLIKYTDFSFRGDSTEEYDNFTTFTLSPEYNIFDQYDWERRGEYLTSGINAYSLIFNLKALSLDDPFDQGFDLGFEENYLIPDILVHDGNKYLAIDGTPLSTQGVYINPTENFKLSSLEICNSGYLGIGPRTEDFVGMYMEVPPTGRRLERIILPIYMPTGNYLTGLWPEVSGEWVDDRTNETNLDSCGAKKLINSIRRDNATDYITLQNIFGVPDSGKLVLKFSHGDSDVTQITEGAFNFEFDQGNDIWWRPNGAFNRENYEYLHRDANFFDVESITLKIIAKKSGTSRNFNLDVVGWSDDKLLNITPASGGFIQDPSGVFLNDTFIGQQGQHPVLSGYYGDDQSLSENSISELDDYYEASGNDHYKLSQYPTVNRAGFKEYEIPLTIIDEQVRLGLGRNYGLSTLFENLHLDIYPIPSGASIAYAGICVRYAPQTAMNMSVKGGPIRSVQDGRSESALYPFRMLNGNDFLNAGSGYGPLSQLEGLPHAYGSPNTLKTNYARRWRGVDGLTVRGPYDPAEFGFGFENPVMDYPFASGYYKFDDIDGLYVKSSYLGPDFGLVSGKFVTTPEVYQNIGWRYSNDNGTNGLFQTQLPGYTGPIKTIDWTSLSDGVTDYTNDPLYGKLADAFDRAVRVSQSSQHLTFEGVDSNPSGVSIFLRFTPDSNVSGVDYNLFDSGVLFAAWEDPFQLDLALAYDDGYLTLYYKDDSNVTQKVTDPTYFDQYIYPLSVMVTYTHDCQFRLYADNEASGAGWNVLRGESPVLDRYIVDQDLTLGWCQGSGVGFNMFVHEFGISSGNLTPWKNNVQRDKEVEVNRHFGNIRAQYHNPDMDYVDDRYVLWDRVADDTYNDWQIGAFQHCPFSPAFDQWALRPSKDMIVWDLVLDGTSYISKTTKALPNFLSDDKEGVCYHTQAENDFLRFNLTDVPDSFYSVDRRITKNIPAGYSFKEDALVVESVVNHQTLSGVINWGLCDELVGPKLIVSLYTRTKESYWNDPNPYGLVNRKIHYVPPSSCVMRFDSTFTYSDISEELEDWAIFDSEPLLDEFGEKYFAEDINDMFVQYDLVYPTTGKPYRSRLELFASHVRMVDANITPLDENNDMNLVASGAFAEDAPLNLNMPVILNPESGTLSLIMNVPQPLSGVMNLYTSGSFSSQGSMSLYLWDYETDTSNLNLFTSGGIFNDAASGVNLVMPKTLGRLNLDMPLVVAGPTGVSTSGYMSMFAYASNVGEVANRTFLNTFLKSEIGQSPDSGEESGVFNMNIKGFDSDRGGFNFATMPLFIDTPKTPSGYLPLVAYNRIVPVDASGFMNMSLFTSGTYGSSGGGLDDIVGVPIAIWDSYSYGTGIEIDDETYLTVPVSNEIRGVDLTAWGSCDGDSTSKAIDQPISTDCVNWTDATCNEAGIFRAKATYSNSGALSFDGVTIGYENNYYGTRKYTGLFPGIGYDTTLTPR